MKYQKNAEGNLVKVEEAKGDKFRKKVIPMIEDFQKRAPEFQKKETVSAWSKEINSLYDMMKDIKSLLYKIMDNDEELRNFFNDNKHEFPILGTQGKKLLRILKK